MQTLHPTEAVGTTSGGLYSNSYAIRFSHCDPAGIVFYPQYFVLINGLVEDWFTLGLKINYADLIGQRKVGLPTVSLHCDFVAPSRMGEDVAFHLRTSRVGKRSITLDITATGLDGQRLKLQQTLVTTSLETHKSINIPTDVLNAITHWHNTTGVPL
ncbi:acyl-CoA thioesterase [Rhodoferax aquaticus]|uniref:Acyl-CoA thioesterase n=1 Tax=Rhodoferax aquaticus TaxID=2527691 RepID=A0A515EUB6_9BURK|nr:thioesterase family protein [Rhodoferax aquaticus]QDL56163.1 acyl-CoA thioesterase [Rhodoferax aquaticus]